jgi:hypothetical protein
VADQFAYAPEAAGRAPTDPWAALGIPVAPQGQQPQQADGGDPWAAVGIPVAAQTAEPAIQLEPGERVLNVGGPDRTPVSTNAQQPSSGAAPSWGESLGRGINQGVTFNFGDELAGAESASGLPDAPNWLGPLGTLYNVGTRAPIGAARLAYETAFPPSPSIAGVVKDQLGIGGDDTAWGRYNRTVEAERAANEAAQQANPGSYLAGELVGTLPTALVAPELAPFKLAQGASTLARAGRVAARTGNLASTGATYGGIAGAGGAEGNLIDRLPAAGTGAATGAVLSPVVGGTAAGLGAGARFARGHVAASFSPQRLADRVVARALENDAADVPALTQRMADANLTPPAGGAQGPPQLTGAFTPADIAGPNTQSLAGQIARTPGPGRAPARQFLEERQLGSDPFSAPGGGIPSQGERISERIGQMLGDRRLADTAEGIIEKRAKQSEPLYRAAYGKQIDYDSPAGRDLKALLERVPNDAKAKANSILRIEDKGGRQLIWNETPDANGNYKVVAVPNMRQWDYIKRGLDTAIEGARDPATGRLSTYGNAVAGLKREMVGALDSANPAYAGARKVFAGHSDMLDALNAGRDIWGRNVSRETVERQMKALSPGEQEMFRLGAANALREQLANAGDGANKVRTAFGSQAVREKMRAIAPDTKSMEALTTFLKNEQAMFETRARALGGSPTAERLSDAEDVAQRIHSSLHMLAHVKTGNAPGLVKAVFTHLGKIDPERRGAVMEAARSIVLNPDPQAVRDFVQRVETSGMSAKARQRFYGAVVDSLPRATVTHSTGAPDRPRLPAPAY